jgi:epoxide hydrolase-like predicted phosphatase
MYKAVIFDFFGVFRTDAYREWLQANAIPYEGAYLEAARQQDLGNITNEEFLQRLSKLQGKEITRKILDEHASVDADVIKIAEALRKNYKTALVSNAPSEFIRHLLDEHNLARLFDEIVISSEVGIVKPSNEIFELMLRRLRVKPSEVVFIDDNAEHVAAAKKLGIEAVLFRTAKTLHKEIKELGFTLG